MNDDNDENNFNSRPSARGDPPPRPPSGACCYFNSRPSARGDFTSDARERGWYRFQFTPLREGRRDARGQRHIRRYFNSRPSARGDAGGSGGRWRFCYFNSRPSARGDAHGGQRRRHADISIHAPPRGATFVAFRQRLPCKFQFTPLREGRPGRECRSARCGYFNSRPSARGDVRTWSNWDGTSISIHAPPRGATRHLERWLLPRCYFNSRPSARGDAPPLRAGSKPKHFNSRPSARGDDVHHHQGNGKNCISIHAPPRGATNLTIIKTSQINLFQFTPLREGRPDQHHQPTSRPAISIHAPPRGATNMLLRLQNTQGLFQFTPLREGRLTAAPKTRSRAFQFTPLREGRRRVCAGRSQRRVYFNSRPSARGDGAIVAAAPETEISIHAPPRGATKRIRSGAGKPLISIHAPPRGATRRRASSMGAPPISIHAPPRGATERKNHQQLHI